LAVGVPAVSGAGDLVAGFKSYYVDGGLTFWSVLKLLGAFASPRPRRLAAMVRKPTIGHVMAAHFSLEVTGRLIECGGIATRFDKMEIDGLT
jgi:hypothetical protein